MKTYKNFENAELNYEDLAFFLSIKTAEAKAIINNLLNLGYTPAGKPVAKASDRIYAQDIPQLRIRSNSNLDGKSRLKLICDAYNKGVSIGTLRDWSQNETYIKAVGFTGNMKPAAEILNPDQLRKLQKAWLVENVASNLHLTKQAEKFIKANDWAAEFLKEKDLIED